MGLFEAVQQELFEFMGYSKRPALSPKNLKSPQKHKPEVIKLGELPYPVEISRKPNLRGLRFSVSLKGVLEISANKTSPEAEILSLLRPHLNWIEEQSKKHALTRSNFPQKYWRSGELFAFNGKNLEMLFSPSSTKHAHIRFMANSFEYFFPIKWMELSKENFQKRLHEKFLYFFKLKASEVLDEKVKYWSQQMSLFPKSVTYRNQKSRWGSCSSNGSINLNWRLSAFSKEIQDYVIVHELAHLRHQDHSKNFWSLVEEFIPNRKKISKKLQKTALSADAFSVKSELYQNNPAIWESKDD